MARRDVDTSVFDLEPGDYRVVREPVDTFGRFCVWLCTPNGDRIRVPVRDGPQDQRPLKEGGSWGLTEHEDGTISLTPSLNVHGSNAWHGFLTNGVMTPA